MRGLIILLGALALMGSALAEQNAFDPEADFDAFWTLYDERYALFEVKGVDWDKVYDVYRPQVSENTTRAELFSVFESVTDLLNDVHVTVRDTEAGRFARSGGKSLGTGSFDVGTFSMELIESAYAQGGLTVLAGGTMRYGMLRGGIGYLKVDSFKYPTTSEAAADEIARAFADAPAVIVDVRQNGGGSDAVARMLAARFADERRLVMTSEERLPGEDVLGGPQPWHVGPVPGALRVPIFVLVNDRTISAAENFAIMMRAFPHVTILGETTAGAMADTFPVALGEGWVFGVPSNVLRDANGRSWEGIGVVPNLFVANTAAEVAAGRDRQLETALDFAETAGPRLLP
ncbi:S41 family peptidase [Parvularcula maris]|uniref:S41 family peptidase n=1 Tax=Parvularcula maris TaxID=2965077 RepID=A0A9X2LBF4_9PROT|nr:S41 family peptidase [Parvularcula maris]MCQ8186476.1 S41 family peptidase [Parvularcula maris]